MTFRLPWISQKDWDNIAFQKVWNEGAPVGGEFADVVINAHPPGVKAREPVRLEARVVSALVAARVVRGVRDVRVIYRGWLPGGHIRVDVVPVEDEVEDE